MLWVERGGGKSGWFSRSNMRHRVGALEAQGVDLAGASWDSADRVPDEEDDDEQGNDGDGCGAWCCWVAHQEVALRLSAGILSCSLCCCT